MRLAVLSDIHGNGLALDTVLDALHGMHIDRYVCLGDAIEGGPQPVHVVNRLRDLGCPVVLGNADAWLLTGGDTGEEAIAPERAARLHDIRAWSLAQLSAEDGRTIAAYQPTVALTLEGGMRVLAYHGSPNSFDEVILPDIAQDKLAELLRGHNADLYCGGHTHVQFVRRLGTGPQLHFNPGSIGVAFSHHQPEGTHMLDPWAEFAIVEMQPGRSAIAFHRVALDVDRLIAIYSHSDIPHSAQAIAQLQRT
jgi:predicted phosphodiesterase